MLGTAMPFGFVLAILVLPLKKAVAPPPGVKRLIALAVVGVVGFALSCLMQGVSIPDSNIGQSLSFAIFLMAFTRVVDGTATAAHLLAWFAAGQIGYYLLARPKNTLGGFDDLWKYGIAYPVATVAVYVCTTRQKARPLLIPVLIVLGVGSIFLNYRSMGLVCMLTAVVCYVQGRAEGKGKGIRFVIGGAVVVALAEVLPRAMESGFFGLEIQQRALGQTADDTPAILGGRTESPLSIAAIMAKPLFGWGNLQTIDRDTVAEGVRVADFLGMHNPAFFMPVWIRPDGRISLHSIFFSAWVEGGIVGVLLPATLLVIFVIAMLRASGAMMPIVAFAAAHGIWDLLFSPWGGSQSIAFAAYTILALWSLSEAKPREPELAGVLEEPVPRRR